MEHRSVAYIMKAGDGCATSLCLRYSDIPFKKLVSQLFYVSHLYLLCFMQKNLRLWCCTNTTECVCIVCVRKCSVIAAERKLTFARSCGEANNDFLLRRALPIQWSRFYNTSSFTIVIALPPFIFPFVQATSALDIFDTFEGEKQQIC